MGREEGAHGEGGGGTWGGRRGHMGREEGAHGEGGGGTWGGRRGHMGREEGAHGREEGEHGERYINISDSSLTKLHS